jgi:hypothetical protein
MITVKRHGARWAVLEGDGPPTAEYETRELAEAAARDMGGEVRVDDSPDGEGLGSGGTGPDTGLPDRDAGIDQRTGGGGSGHETPREGQAGL